MFKKLKEKITEEVKSSPQRLQQLLQQQNTSTADENFFSLSEDDANTSTMEAGFANVSLRRNSNSSIASDVSFLPRYESSPNMYHLQSDFEVSASEMEDNASTSSQLGHLSKEQLYSAFQKAQKQHHKYRGRYVDLARHYKELERENTKMKSVLVETQDKAIRRVGELREQCNLEQKAKAHLENALRVELDEKQYKIETLQTQIGLLQESDGDKHSIVSTIDETEAEIIRKDLNDARSEIETLNIKLQEMKANNIIYQSKENDYKNKIANLENEMGQLLEREKGNNLKYAQNKMELHNELLVKDSEIGNLKTEIDMLRQTKNENLQMQNKKLIEKVESLTEKCNNYESELLKMEQYKIEIELLCGKQREFVEERGKFEEKLAEQRDSAKKALLSLETRVKEQIAAEHAVKEEKMRSEFLQKIENLTTNQDQLKDVQMKLFEQEDLVKNFEIKNRELNETLQNLQKKYKELEDNHLQLINEASSQRNTIANLNKDLDETKNNKANFENEIERLTANLLKFQDVLAKVKNEKNKIIEEKQQSDLETAKLLENLQNELSLKTDDLNKKNEQLENEIVCLRSEKAKLLEELQENNDSFKLQIKQYCDAAAAIQQQNQDLLCKIDEKSGVILDLKSQLQEMTEKYEIQNQNIQLQENQMKELESKYSILLDENENLKGNVLELRKSIEIKNETSTQQIIELQSKLFNNETTQIQLNNEIEKLTKENAILLNQISEMKIKFDLAQIETNNYKEIADKIASEKQILLEELNNLKTISINEDTENVDKLKIKMDELFLQNVELQKQIETLQQISEEKSDYQAQLKELEHQYSEILHEKQLLQDEVQELKTSPLNLNENKKLKTENNLPLKQCEDEINQLHEKLIQYQSMDLTNKSTLEFYQNELEKLKNKNEKLSRKLDETLVTLNHCTDLSNSTEIEYLRNVLFNYMLGKESLVLARVIAAVCKFDDNQTELILQKEQQRQSLLGHLGIL